MKTKKMTTTNDDGHEGGFDEDRDDGADNPDEDVPQNTAAITAGGARVFSETSGLRQGFATVPSGLHRRAHLQNACTRHPCSPRARGKDTKLSIERCAVHPVAHMARRWGTWAHVVPRPPPPLNSAEW